MSTPTDAPPPAASVWPPTPTHAPTTFMVEGVTAIVSSERLVVDNPKHKRPYIAAALAVPISAFIGTAAIMYAILPSVHSSLPPSHVPSGLFALLGISAGCSLVNGLWPWFSYFLTFGHGSVVFAKDLRQVTSGSRLSGGTGQVGSVYMSKRRLRRWCFTDVFYRLSWVERRAEAILGVPNMPPVLKALASHALIGSRRGRRLGPFREPENAARLAEEVGRFLGLPVERA